MKIAAPLFIFFLICSSNAAWAQHNYPRGTYTCVTASGHRITADRPIREYMDREQRIIGRSGTTLAIIQPQKTPEQLSLERAELERQRLAEQQRQHMLAMVPSLLQTYPSQQEHLSTWQRQIAPLSNRLERARSELIQLEQQRQALLQQVSANGYTTYTIPAQLQQGLEFNERDMAIQQRAVESLEMQINAAQEAFQKEHELLIPFWNQSTTNTPGAES